jgi:diguanylate cyclase (GGDEF)-like protein
MRWYVPEVRHLHVLAQFKNGTHLAIPEKAGSKSENMTPLRLLLIEDNEDDATLVTRALRNAGYAVSANRVDTEDALRAALLESPWDIAIADHTMPSFSGVKALAIVREHGIDLPFIFVSGTIGEDVAVAAMKTGAHDYIMKGNLARLPPAVERELREAAVRREHTRANERVAYLAYHDQLTDLPNRALLNDRLHQAILTARREEEYITLLVLDLDGFKEINDALGHHAGDLVLQQVAARLRKTLRESDTIARLGGDEFAILLPTTSLEGGELAAYKVLHELEQPIITDGRPLLVRASIGVASFPAHAGNGQELLQKADVAMYQAKTDGSGYAIYSSDRDRHTEQRLSLMTALRHGLDTQQFILDYQPIVDLRTQAVSGVEALLRWEHPEHGRMMPDDFINVAEQSGLITPLTTFAIGRALAEWPLAARDANFMIAVNVSPRCLHDVGLPARIRDMMEFYQAKPQTLALEITESLIMSDPDRSLRCLAELHDMGLQIIVDDFGTGYSSLSYLRRLPVSQLKIDKSFVIGLSHGEDYALVRSIIDLAHNMRLRVIAEGVENEEVYNRLVALGCDSVQGHFVARPASAATIAEWMRARP